MNELALKRVENINNHLINLEQTSRGYAYIHQHIDPWWPLLKCFNSLAPGKYDNNFKSIIF